MPIKMMREEVNEKLIKEGHWYFTTNFNKICTLSAYAHQNPWGSVERGQKGVFLAYPKTETDCQIVVTAQEEDGLYYVSPMFAPDMKLLLLSEDTLHGTPVSESKVDAIITSNQKNMPGFRGERDFPSIDYILSKRELVCENPLGLYVNSLKPLTELPEQKRQALLASQSDLTSLESELKILKLEGRLDMIDYYEKIDKEVEEKSKQYTK